MNRVCCVQVVAPLCEGERGKARKEQDRRRRERGRETGSQPRTVVDRQSPSALRHNLEGPSFSSSSSNCTHVIKMTDRERSNYQCIAPLASALPPTTSQQQVPKRPHPPTPGHHTSRSVHKTAASSSSLPPPPQNRHHQGGRSFSSRRFSNKERPRRILLRPP